MCTSEQFDREVLRILLYRNHATELLIEAAGGRMRLPAMTVPRNARVAAEITAKAKHLWNITAAYMFPVAEGIASGNGVPSYHVLELAGQPTPPPDGMHWLPAASWSAFNFEDDQDIAAVQSSLRMLDQFRTGKLPGPFGKLGWLQAVREWVQARAEGHRLSLNGEFRQLNATPTFSLIRFETNGPALWFKAVGEPNLREYSITLELAKLFPMFLPYLIGSHSDWNAWLSVEDEGVHLGRSSRVDEWQSAATTLASLQLAAFGNGIHLIQAGCRDARPCSLIELLEPFFECMAELMEQQQKALPPPVSRSEIVSLAKEIRSALEEWSASEIPNALGHLDLNPGNILVSPERCIFLDWAEACVAHPFITFQYLVEHRRRLNGADLPSEEALASAYSIPWQSVIAPATIRTGLEMAPLLAVFTYATASSAWRDPEALRRPVIAGYLRSLVRRMMREADTLREGRPTCVR
jgi:hypothetical protein